MPSGIYKRPNGYSGYWKGKHPPNEWKKGHIISLKTREKMSLSHKGEKSYKWKGGKPKCLTCGKELSAYTSKICKNCYIKLLKKNRPNAWKKDKNPSWKGGFYSIAEKIRASLKYQEWRQQIFIRDNFTCQKCKVKGGYLEAHHHKKIFSKLLQEVKINLPLFDLYDGAMIYTPLWNLNNGITLCKKCHQKTKNYCYK